MNTNGDISKFWRKKIIIRDENVNASRWTIFSCLPDRIKVLESDRKIKLQRVRRESPVRDFGLVILNFSEVFLLLEGYMSESHDSREARKKKKELNKFPAYAVCDTQK